MPIVIRPHMAWHLIAGNAMLLCSPGFTKFDGEPKKIKEGEAYRLLRILSARLVRLPTRLQKRREK